MPANGPADDRTPLLLLLLLGGVLFFANLGGTDLWNPDEPRYAQVAREMVIAAEPAGWLVPHLNGRVYLQKPPAFFWTVGAFGLAVGRVDEWAARLPSACAATLTLLLAYLFGARLFGRRAGLLGAVVLATSLLFVVMARKATIDATLTLQVLASLMLLEEGVRWPERRVRAWSAAFFFMGVGALLKGVGFVLPLLALIAYLALLRNLRPLASGSLLLGLLIAVGVAGAWAAAAARVEGWDYVSDLLFGQLKRRFSESGGHDRAAGYYF
ncbi:MAG: glycosyltransferase family 39 protein, partial [Planctomycetes bacterium]|nr:glycosyltransferase family 39 protein [Planctomycetota bacterium]